ncbi:hypothetical protein CPB86DRAFT_827399 [Serendipita vermifera]|nr:hypothetical protein CPB86DRAFT_827399 [Serendipita vermifera]
MGTMSLPNELWLDILRYALRPDEIIDGKFDPHQIDQAVRLLAMDTINNHDAMRLKARRRRDLKVVCRIWNSLVDVIPGDDWILATAVYDNVHMPIKLLNSAGDRVLGWMHPSRAPLLTEGFDKVKLSYSSRNGSDVQIVCTHPVINLTITTSSTSVDTQLTSLSNIISFPTELRVLHLELANIVGPHDLFSYLETCTFKLTTLSLDIPTREVIPVNLTIASLKNLFIAFPRNGLSLWFESFEWRFPHLQNLSLDVAGYPDHAYLQGQYKLPMLFDLLLRHHQQNLISLRVNPPFQELLQRDSSFFWTKSSKLEAFAANFSHQSFTSMDPPPMFGSNLSPPRSISIRHLIQISWDGFQLGDVIRGLKTCIKLCGFLETITIPRNLMRNSEVDSIDQLVKELRILCQRRNVRVLNMDGEEMWSIGTKDRGLIPTFDNKWLGFVKSRK